MEDLKNRGNIEDERRKGEGKTEERRREVGDRSEEFHLYRHTIGIESPEFRRADLRNLEFKSYLSKKIIEVIFRIPY
jgi:hypothetical protein